MLHIKLDPENVLFKKLTDLNPQPGDTFVSDDRSTLVIVDSLRRGVIFSLNNTTPRPCGPADLSTFGRCYRRVTVTMTVTATA